MILFVGDTPSKRTHPTIAFRGAACEARLAHWIALVAFDEPFILINRTDIEFDRTLTMCLTTGVTIIALGLHARKALGSVGHFMLPHPSGRNRLLNDKVWLASQLHLCKNYIKASKDKGTT